MLDRSGMRGLCAGQGAAGADSSAAASDASVNAASCSGQPFLGRLPFSQSALDLPSRSMRILIRSAVLGRGQTVIPIDSTKLSRAPTPTRSLGGHYRDQSTPYFGVRQPDERNLAVVR